jgi:hypothetical protein
MYFPGGGLVAIIQPCKNIKIGQPEDYVAYACELRVNFGLRHPRGQPVFVALHAMHQTTRNIGQPYEAIAGYRRRGTHAQDLHYGWIGT